MKISKCINIFLKGYTPNWSEEVFVIKKVKDTYHEHMLLVISKVKKLVENSMKKSGRRQATQSSGL